MMIRNKESLKIISRETSLPSAGHGAKSFDKQSYSESDRASVALEYVLVSSFAAVAGIALLGIAASIFKSKVETMMESLDLDPSEYRLNPFESFNEG